MKNVKRLVLPKKGLQQPSGAPPSITLDAFMVEPGFNSRLLKNTIPDEEFLAIIEEQGILVPFHVRQKKGSSKLWLIDGHRRFAAATKLKLKRAEFINHGIIGDKEAHILAGSISDNMKSWVKAEVAIHYRTLRTFGMTDTEIAQAMGRSKATISEYSQASKASPKMRKGAAVAKKSGGIPTKAAARASKLPKRVQERLAPRLEGTSQRHAMELVRDAENKEAAARSVKRDRSPGIGRQKAARQSQRKFGVGSGKPNYSYAMASDYKARCESLDERITERLRQTPNNKELLGMQKVIAVMRGKMSVDQAFIRY